MAEPVPTRDKSTTQAATQGARDQPALTPAGEGALSDQWLEGTLEQVFLTPRVVDERAFEELSGSLKGLVRDAAGQSRALIATTGEVKLLGDQLREATSELQQRVDTAIRVIPTLDQRVAKAEQLLELSSKELAAKVAEMREVTSRPVVIDRERLAAQVRTEAQAMIDSMVQEQLANLRQRITASIEESLTSSREQAQQIARDFDSHVVGTVTTAQGSVAGAVKARSELECSLLAAQEKMTGLAAELARLGAEQHALGIAASELGPGMDERVRQMGAWLNELLTQGDQIGRGLDRLIRTGSAMLGPTAPAPGATEPNEGA